MSDTQVLTWLAAGVAALILYRAITGRNVSLGAPTGTERQEGEPNPQLAPTEEQVGTRAASDSTGTGADGIFIGTPEVVGGDYTGFDVGGFAE